MSIKHSDRVGNSISGSGYRRAADLPAVPRKNRGSVPKPGMEEGNVIRGGSDQHFVTTGKGRRGGMEGPATSDSGTGETGDAVASDLRRPGTGGAVASDLGRGGTGGVESFPSPNGGFTDDLRSTFGDAGPKNKNKNNPSSERNRRVWRGARGGSDASTGVGGSDWGPAQSFQWAEARKASLTQILGPGNRSSRLRARAVNRNARSYKMCLEGFSPNRSGFISHGPSDRGRTWDVPENHSSFSPNEVTANDPFGLRTGIYYPLSLEQLHQRLLWVETAVLGWQLEGCHPSNTNAEHVDETHCQSTSSPNSIQNSKTGRKRTAPAAVRRTSAMKQRRPSKICKILGERRRGRGWQYQVLWAGGGSSDCNWLAGKTLEVDGAEALSSWQNQKQLKALTL
ncbi:hypothetical protein B0H10DRAFT_1951759 [Mycena sp. CBHHK59/15]|nr:hypothetical protein B0H10DRAFT_1951759 [Mycena sp. CBHHK59/15]